MIPLASGFAPSGLNDRKVVSDDVKSELFSVSWIAVNADGRLYEIVAVVVK